MSAEAPKPVEEPVVAPTTTETEAPEATEAPAVPSTEPVVEATTETPAVAEPAVEEEAAAPAPKEEVKPVEEGVLGYKGPGLLK